MSGDHHGSWHAFHTSEGGRRCEHLFVRPSTSPGEPDMGRYCNLLEEEHMPETIETGETVDLTPVINPMSYSPHAQTIKEIVVEISKRAAPNSGYDLEGYVVASLGRLRDAVADLLGDELLLMVQNIRRPGMSYMDTLERKNKVSIKVGR